MICILSNLRLLLDLISAFNYKVQVEDFEPQMRP